MFGHRCMVGLCFLVPTYQGPVETQAGAENPGQAGGECGQWAECQCSRTLGARGTAGSQPGEQGQMSLSTLSMEDELKGQHPSASSTNFSAASSVLRVQAQLKGICWQCVVLDLHLCEPPEMPLA